MKVEIWSDMVCPFCYIGKKHFEEALRQFSHKDEVEVVWKSFELNPDAKRDYESGFYTMLAGKFNTTPDKAKTMNQRVIKMASDAGLTFNMDNAIPTNSFDAHRLVHLAAKHGLQDKAEDKIFSAYFTEAKHIGNKETLKNIAVDIGLNAEETDKTLSSEEYSYEVRTDEDEAHELGVSGVPFFIFNRKYAVSGAQPVELFSEVLQEVWDEEHATVS
jgi:predicted DsbA family dithiol-disulfide isomerase